MLRPRTRAAIGAARAAGVHVIVVTGRMFRSVRPYVLEAGIDDPVICYQGAVVADPVTGEFLRHVPIPLPDALEAIDTVVAAGFHLNCYVDDRCTSRRSHRKRDATRTSRTSRSTRSARCATG